MDVLIRGEQTRIAVEISITTGVEHELQNLKKCLNEPVDYVICLSPDDGHRANIRNRALEELPATQVKRLKFLSPQNLSSYLSQFDERESHLIRGYQVFTTTAPLDPEDLAYREMRLKRLLEGMKES